MVNGTRNNRLYGILYAWQLLVTSNQRNLHTEYSIISTLMWLTLTRLLLITFNEVNFSTAFSLSLGIAAFILMCIGMRYHVRRFVLLAWQNSVLSLANSFSMTYGQCLLLVRLLSSSALELFSLSSHSSIKSLKMLSLMRMNKNRSKPQH